MNKARVVGLEEDGAVLDLDPGDVDIHDVAAHLLGVELDLEQAIVLQQPGGETGLDQVSQVKSPLRKQFPHICEHVIIQCGGLCGRQGQHFFPTTSRVMSQCWTLTLTLPYYFTYPARASYTSQ